MASTTEYVYKCRDCGAHQRRQLRKTPARGACHWCENRGGWKFVAALRVNEGCENHQVLGVNTFVVEGSLNSPQG